MPTPAEDAQAEWGMKGGGIKAQQKGIQDFNSSCFMDSRV